MTLRGVLVRPPVHQRLERLAHRRDLPVQLRDHRVAPALLHPALRVGVQPGVGVEPHDLGRVPRAPDAEGADREQGAGLAAAYEPVHAADETVDVVAAPVVAPEGAAVAGVLGVGRVVGEGAVLVGVGVEIVVHVHAVDVVAGQEIVDHAHRQIPGLGRAGVQPQVPPVVAGQVRASVDDVARRVGPDADGVACAERIDPGVEIDAPAVGAADPIGQRVVSRAGRGALGAREERRPRLDVGLVQRVAGRADLEEDRVEFQAGALVEDAIDLGLLFAGREPRDAGPVDVVHGRDPHPPELAGGHRRGVRRVASGRRRRAGADGSCQQRGRCDHPASVASVHRTHLAFLLGIGPGVRVGWEPTRSAPARSCTGGAARGRSPSRRGSGASRGAG